ncbi:MAG: response regulator [Planctomycetes bacterium]|nr:response regulator [Planctomycetota bacterium]
MTPETTHATLPEARECIIWVVDDSNADLLLAEEACRNVHFQGRLRTFTSGPAVLQELLGEEWDEEHPQHLPDLLILDLNMPAVSGRDILRIIKQNEKVRDIPVVMLTNSMSVTDRCVCTAIGASDYCRKPHDYLEFVALVKLLIRKWCPAACGG